MADFSSEYIRKIPYQWLTISETGGVKWHNILEKMN
jgi:hypothetical protein